VGDAVMPLDTSWNFLSRRRAEVPDFAHAIESDAPSPGEFRDALRQQFDFTVLARCKVHLDEPDFAE
jgi:hypothetical protein